MEEPPLFNPLDKSNLGKSIVDALLSTEASPLANVPEFRGAGIYAIYYSGDFELYRPLADLNRNSATFPIYVGKAVPRGGRKGASSIVSLSSKSLAKRLTEHEKSVRAVPSLRLEDFHCRSLVVDDIWISLGEALVIERFRPLWNVVLDGFGNHDPGKGRYKGRRPLWDELHPGRSWAALCTPPNLILSEIGERVAAYMERFSTDQSPV